jgi:hypothetical protein
MPVTSEQLEAFRTKLQAMINDYHIAAKNSGSPPEIVFMRGRKLVRIVRQFPGERSVYAFIDLTTGDLLRKAGWDARAKEDARGNILAENPLACCGPYGLQFSR